MVCCYEGCDRPVQVKSTSQCMRHYHQEWRARKHPGREPRQPKAAGIVRSCTIDGCTEKVLATGKCHRHYHRAYHANRTKDKRIARQSRKARRSAADQLKSAWRSLSTMFRVPVLATGPSAIRQNVDNVRCIYQIRHLVSGKRYIGSTVQARKRWFEHRRRLRRNEHHSPALQAAWNKYAEALFVFEVIEVVGNSEDLVAREQYFIDTYRPDYNVATLATGGGGREVSDDTRRKLSERLKGRIPHEAIAASVAKAEARRRSTDYIAAQALKDRERAEQQAERGAEANRRRRATAKRKTSDRLLMLWDYYAGHTRRPRKKPLAEYIASKVRLKVSPEYVARQSRARWDNLSEEARQAHAETARRHAFARWNSEARARASQTSTEKNSLIADGRALQLYGLQGSLRVEATQLSLW